MAKHWMRHRMLYTIIMSIFLALIVALLFIAPYIEQKAKIYESQSIYHNTLIDFVAPEPSFDQVKDLPGTNGIKEVFPYYLTSTSVNINGKSRTTTVLITDKNQNLDITMYNQPRLIEKSIFVSDNSVLVDKQFCQTTNAKIDDIVTITIGDDKQDYQISSIYETNTLYDGGAILIQVPGEQIDSIRQLSQSSGYSGMYISANNYDDCRYFLTNDYRPLGRLQSRERFNNDEQYQIHYDAIMSSGYANEITDFHIRESALERGTSSISVWLAGLLTLAGIIAYNIFMSRRGCEKVYFTKNCLPKGLKINPYYSITFVSETVLCIVFYALIFVLKLRSLDDYIPYSLLDFSIAVFPIAVIIAELISYFMNREQYRINKQH